MIHHVVEQWLYINICICFQCLTPHSPCWFLIASISFWVQQNPQSRLWLSDPIPIAKVQQVVFSKRINIYSRINRCMCFLKKKKKQTLTSLYNLLNFLFMFAEYLIEVVLGMSATTLSRYIMFEACLPQCYLKILPVLFTELSSRKISNS